MTESAIDRLLADWCEWAAKVLDCGVANIGTHTAGEIRAWAELAEAAGWHREATIARSIVAQERPTGERAGSFLTSTGRLAIARGLRLRQRLSARDG